MDMFKEVANNPTLGGLTPDAHVKNLVRKSAKAASGLHLNATQNGVTSQL